MIFLFQMTISCDHSIRFEDLIYIIKEFEPTKLAYRFALIFVVPLNIADDFPKQRITGATLFDDLKNSPVENIRGIGPILGAQLRSSPYNISTMYDFYVATQDQLRCETMTRFLRKPFISNFVTIVDDIKLCKNLIDIPQFVLGIDVE